jgi:hypothetical protein
MFILLPKAENSARSRPFQFLRAGLSGPFEKAEQNFSPPFKSISSDYYRMEKYNSNNNCAVIAYLFQHTNGIWVFHIFAT